MMLFSKKKIKSLKNQILLLKVKWSTRFAEIQIATFIERLFHSGNPVT